METWLLSYLLLLATNVVWGVFYFKLLNDKEDWTGRARRAEKSLREQRKAHAMILAQLEEILHSSGGLGAKGRLHEKDAA